MKNKKVTKKWSFEVEIKGLKPLGILKAHQDTRESLDHSITKKEIDKERLKKSKGTKRGSYLEATICRTISCDSPK
jgi:hypothetical protein